MRGKAVHKGLYRPALRITPACAGKSSIVPSSVLRRRDHPRLCGEKERTQRARGTQPGSPPPVRGKALCTPGRTHPPRITPACAGKRASPSSPWSHAGDHPRLCGEKVLVLCMAAPSAGSPPPVRGKAHEHRLNFLAFGITPACAGKSLFRMGRQTGKEDHPRLCGEKQRANGTVRTSSGSPPRVRGKARRCPSSAGRGRITPACAGKSLRRKLIYAL